MNSFTFRYSGVEHRDSFPTGTTLAQMKADPRLQANLRFDGKRVEGHIGGYPQVDTMTPPPGSVISWQDKSTEKHG